MDPRLGSLPETCKDPSCRHTNFGGEGREHLLTMECPAAWVALRGLRFKLNTEFQDAYFSLPHLDKLGGIKYHESTETVSMSLESFKALAAIFKDSAHYGLRNPEGGVYELKGMDFKTARDLAEFSGADLLQKYETGWFDA